MKRLFLVLTVVSIVVLAGAFSISGIAQHANAQEATPLPQVATPVASPVAGGVPCTTLFGITPGNACLLVLHGSRDAGPLDLYIDGALAIPGTAFAGLGDFIPVAAGEHVFQFVPSGAAPETAIDSFTANLLDGVAYEVAVLGPVAEIQGQILPVDTRPIMENNTRIRMVNGSTEPGPVDLSIAGGVPLVVDLGPGQTSIPIEVPSGTYALEVRAAGTTDILLPLPGTNLFPNTTYTFYLTGNAADGTLGISLVPVLIPPDLAAPAATPVAQG